MNTNHINERFGGMTEDKHIWLQIAYTHDRAAAEQFRTWIGHPVSGPMHVT